MDSYSSKLKAGIVAAATRWPSVQRLARAAARRLAGRHYVAAIGVVVDGDAVLLARHRFRGEVWGLPGGWVKRREDAARACVREIREETGLAVDVVDVVATEPHAIGEVPVAYGGLTIAFLCAPSAPVDRSAPPRSVEISGLCWLDREECSRLVHGFELTAIDAALRRQRSVLDAPPAGHT